MKKGVIALILLAVLIIIVSPGIVGKLAEDSVGDNLNWAASKSGELVVTSQGFDRGWFSSEGQHRVELGNGSLRQAVTAAAGDSAGTELPALLINTHLDHGVIPLTSMNREQGSLAPGLGSAVSTLQVELADGETIDVPGTFYSTLRLNGDLQSRYALEAGAKIVDDGEVTWGGATINVLVQAAAEHIRFDGDVDAMTFGNEQQTVSVAGLTFSGEQASTSYGFGVGNVDLRMGAMTIEALGSPVGGMQGMTITGSSSVDDGTAAAALRMEMSGQTIPGFGDISIIADLAFDGLDAVALGAVTARLEQLAGATDPEQVMALADKEAKDLVAAGFNVTVPQLDVALPMGTVEAKMSINIPETDRADFQWTSLLLNTIAAVDIKVPEGLVQLATSMSPEAGAIIAMGYLKKNGAFYEMDADYKKGLLTINGAPMPIPLGAIQ